MKKNSRFMGWNSVAAICVLSGISATAFAGPIRSSVYFQNPNGCHAYDGKVVDLSCDWTPSRDACQESQDVLNALAKQVSGIKLSAKCSRYHDDSGFAHFIDEQVMVSDAFDGYRLDLAASAIGDAQPAAEPLTAVAPDPETCENVMHAVLALDGNVLHATASCSGTELQATISR